MVIELFRFIFLFFVFLFTLYAIVHDDHVLFKKNISLERFFNMAFILGGVFLLSARVGYVLFHFTPAFINPLVFILVPYFPGLSIAGGVIGAGLWLYMATKDKKLPSGKLFDFFMASFFSAFVTGWLLEIVTQFFLSKTFLFRDLLIGGVSLVLFLFVLGYFLGKRLKDGSTGFIMLVVFSFLSTLHIIMERIEKNASIFSFEDILAIGIFLVSCVLLLRLEKLLPTIRLWNRK